MKGCIFRKLDQSGFWNFANRCVMSQAHFKLCHIILNKVLVTHRKPIKD